MTGKYEYKYLNNINSPNDVKKLSAEEVPVLAEEIRHFLVENVSKTGGHLASNLGVVELTLAMHRVFNSPQDHFIFDVGHQSYIHKIITGRREEFDTLRQPGGISGFTRRDESEHDCFGAGHSSTSISAALGFAQADKIRGIDSYTVAVVGDGAYTGGMIHEALNNCKKDLKLIIILNENEMSISKNIGLFAKRLLKIRLKSSYFKAKKRTAAILKKVPLIGKPIFNFVLKVKKTFKNIMYGSNYFEDLGLYYIGPVDGNDYKSVESALSEAKKTNGSVVVHLKTIKGKGYEPAENNPDKYHGLSPAENIEVSETLSQSFGDILCELAEDDEKICAITAAMCDGTGLNKFREKFSDRFFDVGIAEEHAVTFAAGLAADGMRPCVAIYSTFLQRAYDNILHDVALQNLPVTFCIDRAGINTKDGPTHHGIFDVAFLSQIPNLTIYTPVTKASLKKAMISAFYSDKPAAVRYSNVGEDKRVIEEFYSTKTSRKPSVIANYNKESNLDAVIITYGKIVKESLLAMDELSKQNICCGVILLERLKPYDTLSQEIIDKLPVGIKTIVFLEEGIKNGGASMLIYDAMNTYLSKNNIKTKILAIDDNFALREKGKSAYESAGISKEFVIDAIKNNL